MKTPASITTPVAVAEVIGKVTDYAPDHVIEPHLHDTHQLLYAVQGVMVVQAEGGRWVVPPTRAIWMPAGTEHSLRCIGALQMRSLYVGTAFAPPLAVPPAAHGAHQPQVVGVSALLRELILAFGEMRPPYAADSREGRLAHLILDELTTLPVLPLHLPQPSDPGLRRLCEQLQRRLNDPATLDDWATLVGLNVKTLQRLFAREIGMTFGQWRQQARLLRALEQLATGEKVIDVALALGYDSPSAFTTMFRRQFGLAPSQFFR